MQIDFQDQTEKVSDEQMNRLKKILDFAAQYEGTQENAELSVSFVNNTEIQELNKEYRKKDEPTDVISFALQDEITDSIDIIGSDAPLILGDIIISIEKVEEQAMEYNHSFERELGFLAVHGFLHLLGYDHMNETDEKIMFQKQNDILDGFGLER